MQPGVPCLQRTGHIYNCLGFALLAMTMGMILIILIGVWETHVNCRHKHFTAEDPGRCGTVKPSEH